MESKRRERVGRRSALMALMAVLLVIAASAPLAFLGARQAQADVGSATIVRSADGVLLRAEPTFGAEVLTTLPQGAVVGLRTHELDTVYDNDGVTRWWPVQSDIGDGWVAGFYLDIEGLSPEAGAALSSPAGPTNADSEAVANGTGSSTINENNTPAAPGAVDQWLPGPFALVDDPQGVNMRAEPSAASENIFPLSMGTMVELRTSEADTIYTDGGRWWPVSVYGQDGWIIGTYLAPFDGGAQTAQAVPSVPEVPAVPGIADVPVAQNAAVDQAMFAPGSYVSAHTDNGSGLNIRADGAPDAERIGAIPEFDVVQVMDGPFIDPLGTGWYLITDGAVTGFVDGSWLSSATQPGATSDQFAAAPAAPAPVDTAGLASGVFGIPLMQYTLTQPFGCSPYWWWYPWDANLGCNVHDAADMAAPLYTPLYAADGGTVEYAGWCDCGLGYYVKINHGNGFKSTYGHMADQPIVATGQAVSKGDQIGMVGSTGTSTGPHVHFMVELNGIPVDPFLYTG